jgi:hypothetical protein
MKLPRTSATVGPSPLMKAPTTRHTKTVATSVEPGGKKEESAYAIPELHQTVAIATK